MSFTFEQARTKSTLVLFLFSYVILSFFVGALWSREKSFISDFKILRFELFVFFCFDFS